MRLTQELLHRHAAERIRSFRPDLAERLDLSTTAGLLAAHAEVGAAAEETETVVLSVIRRFDLHSWIRDTYAFAAGLTPVCVAEWRRSFTRTIFLAGNPENLTHRFTFEYVSDDRSSAWTAPAGMRVTTPLRRLLKLFAGPQRLSARPPLTLELPEITGRRGRLGGRWRARPAHEVQPAHEARLAHEGQPAHEVQPPRRVAPPTRRELYIATAGTSVADSVVHLHHLLAEAVFDGLLGPGDRLTVRHVPRLVGVPGPFDALRIGVDECDPNRLRAYAGLTKEMDHD